MKDNVGSTHLRLPLSLANFERLPRHPGCRYEYFARHAEISHRPQYAELALTLAEAAADAMVDAPLVRPLRDADWPALSLPFTSAFWNHPVLQLLPRRQRPFRARQLLEGTRAGENGPLLQPACFVASVHDGAEVRYLGAALVTLIDPAERLAAIGSRSAEPFLHGVTLPHLTWIFVDDWSTRRGIGAALLRAVVDELRCLGYTELASTVMIGNSVALLWHWRRGFRLLGRQAPG